MQKTLFVISFVLGLNFPSNGQKAALNTQNLSKKWVLEKYKVFYFTKDPPEEEKNDYIYFNSNHTFSSVSEGKYEEGTWRLDILKKRIVLTKANEEGELAFIIEELTPTKLVLYIDDPTDAEAAYLKIHFNH